MSRAKDIEHLHLTSQIREENLMTSKEVISFYDEIEAELARRKFGQVEIAKISVPASAVDAINELLSSKKWE